MRFQSFEELLRHWAEASPSGTALCGEGTELSFRDLLERVLRRVDELKQTGKSCLGLLSDGSSLRQTLRGCRSSCWTNRRRRPSCAA